MDNSVILKHFEDWMEENLMFSDEERVFFEACLNSINKDVDDGR